MTDPPAAALPSRAADPVGDRPPTRLGADAWLLAVSVSAGLGTARLTQAPGAAHVIGPVLATVVAGHLATSLARRVRVSIPVTVVSGVVAVVLATVWGQLLASTRSGVPTSTTWRALVAQFDAAGAVIRAHPTPVPATSGVVLCIATGAGLVAVLGRSIWAWAETRTARPSVALVALAPSFGLFCYTALLSSQVDRVAGVIAYLGCALVFIAAADRPGARPGAGAAGRTRRVGAGLAAMAPAVLCAVLAVVVPLAVSPAFTALRVSALPFGPAGGAAGGGGLGVGTGGTGPGGALPAIGAGGGLTGVRAIDLVDNLRAVLTNRTGEVMFSATTPVATYWQVAVLTTFDGTAWLPDATTEAAVQAIAQPPQSRPAPGLPALPDPEPTTTFRAAVTIGDLQSTLLPLPPTAISVDANAFVVPGFGAVEAIEAPPGQRYSTLARVPVSPGTRARGSRPGGPGGPAGPGGPVGSAGTTTPPVPASSLTPYLELPALSPPVVQLAHQIVAGASTPAAQAAALARWFDSGRFRYTLSPPTTAGSDALSSFLFTTRAGFCQQFAAAYAVLARTDGLPTRVAIGFTTGTAQGHDRYRVTGADAHVWPEVYLGPATGWTSYEPTPASSGEPTGIGVNSGSRTGTQNTGGQSTASTASTVASIRHPATSGVSAPSTVPLALHGRTAPTGGGSRVWVLAVVVILMAGVLAVPAGRWVRRRIPDLRRRRERWGDDRRRRAAEADPTAEVLAQWRRAVSTLDRARLGRRPTETLHEHAARLRSLAGAKWLATYAPVPVASASSAWSGGPSEGAPGAGVESAVDAYGELATLAVRASYAPEPCTADEARRAEQLGALVRSGLARPPARRAGPAPL